MVDDVVKNCKDEFLNEGVDVQVLEDLKQVRHTRRSKLYLFEVSKNNYTIKLLCIMLFEATKIWN